MDKKSNLIWVDLEMTGLDETKERIIEMAMIVTDSQLNEIAVGPELVIHQSDALLNAMNEWCINQHTGSGLVQRVRDSRVSEQEAEAQMLSFLHHYVEPKASPMCGNTICTDRRFLARYMPTLEAFFHYRHIDVSTIKELARRWRPEFYSKVKKTEDHRALSDIRASIDELRWYREQWLV